MSNKLVKYLSSLRFTILIISILGVIFALGLWIPQKNLVKDLYFDWQAKAPALVAFLDTLGLTDIYTSPLTLTLWGLFFLNLAFVMWQRIPLIRNRITVSEAKIADPVTAPGYSFRSTYPLTADQDDAVVITLLRKRGYYILGDGKGFYGIKNRYSPIAFALFHLSFFLILLGGIISVYTQFIAYVDLAQGETFQGELKHYNQSPLPAMPKIGGIPKVTFMVESIVPRVVRNTPTGITVKLVDAEGKPHNVGINTPYSVDNTSFVFKHLGMAPLFVLLDPAGKEIDGAYMKLDVLQGRQDRFSLGGYEFTAQFYPDYIVEDGAPATRSQEFNNPVFKIVVERDKKKVVEGNVAKNGVLAFNGYRLEMHEMPFWVRFYVIKERGLSILYAGFAIASMAVIWRLIFFRRELVGVVREVDGARRLVVAGRAEYYKSLAEDEFAKLFNGIVGKLNAR
jgi:cytochrome c biogenesis protein ResB